MMLNRDYVTEQLRPIPSEGFRRCLRIWSARRVSEKTWRGASEVAGKGAKEARTGGFLDLQSCTHPLSLANLIFLQSRWTNV